MAKAKAPTEATIEYMPLETLVAAKRNPKRHNMAAISDAIDRHGYVRPVMLNEKTGRLVAGHGRVSALREMKLSGSKPPARVELNGDGDWLIPVVRGISFKTEAEAEAYLLADNRVGELGGYDEDELRRILNDTDEISGTGFTEEFRDRLDAKLSGEGGRAKNPEELYSGFVNASIKQLVFLFKAAEMEHVTKKLDTIASEHELESHGDVLVHLLDSYENS